MKRTPLKRKTPLKAKTVLRNTLPPKATVRLQQKVPLKPRSDKMSDVYREQRIPLVKELLAKRPACSARLKGCTRRATEVHEIKSRGRGGSITDRENCVTLCHNCHRYITDHPREAKGMGWLKSSWDQ